MMSRSRDHQAQTPLTRNEVQAFISFTELGGPFGPAQGWGRKAHPSVWDQLSLTAVAATQVSASVSSGILWQRSRFPPSSKAGVPYGQTRQTVSG